MLPNQYLCEATPKKQVALTTETTMLIAFGVTISGSLVEVLSTKEGETWTIIVTSSEGSSCIVAMGEGWRTKEYQEHFAEPQT